MPLGSIVKLERRTDIYLSTLRRFVEALGGKLLPAFPTSPTSVCAASAS
jgi:hypothetical protein